MIDQTAPRRRDFLKLLVLSSAAAGAVGLPGEALARKRRKKHFPGKVVFRLRTRSITAAARAGSIIAS
jgi:hypothetical protein